MIRIPYPGKPKARPQVTKRGTYMPEEYTAWRDDIVQWLTVEKYHRMQIEEPVKLVVIFGSDYMDLQLISLGDVKRPTGVRGDVDNLVGGLMDALQEAGVIVDDRHVLGIEAKAWS